MHDYLAVDWSGIVELSAALDEFKAVTMDAESNIEGQNKQLSLGVHVNRENSMDLYVYSPYWIINKTSLPLQIRVSKDWLGYQSEPASRTAKSIKPRLHFLRHQMASNGITRRSTVLESSA